MSNVSAAQTLDGLPKLMEGLVIAVEKKSENIADILTSLLPQIQASEGGEHILKIIFKIR